MENEAGKNPNWGGAREGGGRPRLEATKLREALIRLADENAEALAKALHDKALAGDVPALKETYDRSIGKVTEHVRLQAEVNIVMDT